MTANLNGGSVNIDIGNEMQSMRTSILIICEHYC